MNHPLVNPVGAAPLRSSPDDDPVAPLVRAELEHDMVTVRAVAARLHAELVPAAALDGAPGWSGPAKAFFEHRRHELAADLALVAARLEAVLGDLARALAGIRETP